MKQLCKDIINFLSNLSQIDFLLYFAVLILIILVVSLLYIIKTGSEEEYVETESDSEELDLNEVVTKIENTVPPVVEFTSYEEEQEEKAIISYDELIKKSKTGAINYNDESSNEEISIKKINLDNMMKTEEANPVVEESYHFHYEREENFLKTLQELSKLLN